MDPPSERVVVRYCRIFLTTLGVNSTRPLAARILFLSILFFHVQYDVTTALYVYFGPVSLGSYAYGLLFLFTDLSLILSMVVFQFKFDRAKNIVDSISNDRNGCSVQKYNNSDANDRIVRSATSDKFKHIPYLSACFTLGPLCTWYALNVDTVFLLYPAWYPWNMDGWGLIAAYVTQYSTALSSAAFYYAQMFFGYSVILHIRLEANTLIDMLKNVNQIAKNKTLAAARRRAKNNGCRDTLARSNSDGGLSKTRYFDNVDGFLKEIVIRHRNYVGLCRNFSEFFQISFSSSVIFGTVVNTCGIIIFYHVDVGLQVALQTLCCIFSSNSIMIAACYAGEFFKQINLAIDESIYDLNWYEMPSSIGRNLSLFLSFSKMDVGFAITDKLVASYNLYLAVINKSYYFAGMVSAGTSRKR